MKLKFSLALLALAALGSGAAQASGNVHFSVGVQVGPPVVVAPAYPVYVAPAPVYYAPPPPVYYVRPAPVYYGYGYAPVYYGPPHGHRHGHKGHRGHRH